MLKLRIIAEKQAPDRRMIFLKVAFNNAVVNNFSYVNDGNLRTKTSFFLVFVMHIQIIQVFIQFLLLYKEKSLNNNYTLSNQ